MFKLLKNFLRGKASLKVDKKGKPLGRDLQAAIGALLLQMAGADEDYAPEEVYTVTRIIQRQLGLDTEEAAEVLEMSDELRLQEKKIDKFVALINESFEPSQKQLILAMIWAVVIADGEVEKFENRFATQIRTRFQLSQAAADEARKLAASEQI
ncbi:MAG: TerB family tellurite resistance protein [Deltaproteobacteria bacterium]|nr:TerB family tellurite resistance protein [Deltaproteobacteria bacterium]